MIFKYSVGGRNYYYYHIWSTFIFLLSEGCLHTAIQKNHLLISMTVDWSLSNGEVIGGDKNTSQEAGDHGLWSRLLATGVWPHPASSAALASEIQVQSWGGVVVRICRWPLSLSVPRVSPCKGMTTFYHLLPLKQELSKSYRGMGKGVTLSAVRTAERRGRREGHIWAHVSKGHGQRAWARLAPSSHSVITSSALSFPGPAYLSLLGSQQGSLHSSL